MKKADVTRKTILEAAFGLVYEKGYQNISVDEIIAATGLTKGAFYYHFKSKNEMGIAIIEEVMQPQLYSDLTRPFIESEDPLSAIYDLIAYLLMSNDQLTAVSGCPVSNLASEITPWHTAFRTALLDLSSEWLALLKENLDKGKQSGKVRMDVNSEEVAPYVISGYWGVRNFSKMDGNKSMYTPFLNQLRHYLDSLR